MQLVRLSRTYRLPIPEAVCRSLGLQPGCRLEVFAYAGRIQLVPVWPMKQARGFLRGIDTTVPREGGRA
jgi:hypothetical protein